MSDSTIKHIATVFPITAEALKSEPKLHRRTSIIREFSLNTSTHGIPGIARSESQCNRIFWIVSLLIFASVMTYFITESIRAFFQYPTQTSVSIIVERTQAFPAVTFCNYSPIQYDRFIVPFLNYTNSNNLTNTNDTSTITIQQAQLIFNYLQYKLNRNESLDEFLFPLNSMLLDCNYNSAKCNENDFISFLSSTYGRCYTFNAKRKNLNSSHIRNIDDEGGFGRLVLRLYVHSYQYVPFVAEDVSAGLVAMIHDNTQLPLIDIEGIHLAPGRKHKLSYRKKTNTFLPSPYTECTENIPLVMQAMFNRYEDADYEYSQVICNTLCVQAYIYQECGCISPLQWLARSVVKPGTTTTIIEASLCNITDTCYATATVKIKHTETIWNKFCSDCKQECSSVDFVLIPSSATAPSLPYAYLTKGFVQSTSIPLPTDWETNWLYEVQNNYVSLEVVCESTRVETYTQDPSISPVDVLSNVGGHTGLWIGISFLSIMEFVEMLYRLIRYQFHIIRKRIQKNKTTMNEPL